MPFIPFNTSSYKASSSFSSLENEGSTVHPSNGQAGAQLQGSSTSSGAANGEGGNSTSSSPSLQQGPFQIRRKKSVGSALFSLVTSMRASPAQSSTALRRDSQSSQPKSRSRSASASLSKQVSSSGSDRGRDPSSNANNNGQGSTGELEKQRLEVENANPFDVMITPEMLQTFDHQEYNPPLDSSRINSSSNIPLTTIFSGNDENLEGEGFTALGIERSNNNSNINTNGTGNGVINTPSNNSPANSPANDNTTRPYMHTDLSHTNGGSRVNDTNSPSIVVANIDTSSHNFFNPAAYNYNMSNSQTIANLRDYATVLADELGNNANEVDASRTNSSNLLRTRGNTLREESNYFEPVAMNSENNPTLGTAIDNPITIDDETDENADAIHVASGEGLNQLDERVNVGSRLLNDGGSRAAVLIGETDGDGRRNLMGTLSPTAQTAHPGDLLNRTGENGDADRMLHESDIGGAAALSNNLADNYRSECDSNGFYSIRLTPSIDHSSTHPYMFFGPIIRKIRPGMSLSIGRYTEKSKKAATAAAGSSVGVVFKSKVVSRKHAELTVDENGRWFIQDVKSSSGTFLNHTRLSSPNVESTKFNIKDCDILQFGVDYRGGSEEVYRCVKVKIEINNSWKKRAAKFSKEAHEKLKNLTGNGDAEELTPCVICLDDIKPCQPVFVSSCSHAWHYRCIRPLLVKTYPQFLCPNCKAVCDLEADLDDGDVDESVDAGGDTGEHS